MPNTTDEENNQGDSKRRTRSQYAALETRTHQLERLLKATTKISDFVERVETLETKLKSCHCGSTYAQNSTHRSIELISPTDSVQGNCEKFTLDDIFESFEFRDTLVKESISRMDLLGSFLENDSEKDSLGKPCFFSYAYFALACLLAGSDMNYNLLELESLSLKKAYFLLPSIKMHPSVLNIKGLLLLGLYESRLSRAYSAMLHIDSAFSMIQFIATSEASPCLSNNLMTAISDSEKFEMSQKLSEIRKLDSIWHLILAFKQYSVILFGNASMLRGINSSLKGIQMIRGESVDLSPVAQGQKSLKFGLIVEKCFEIALDIIRSNLKPTSDAFLEKIVSREEIPELERLLRLWKNQNVPQAFRSYMAVVNWLEDPRSGMKRQELSEFLYFNFIRILIYWPTILVFSEPIRFPSTTMLILSEAASDVYHVLEIWDQHITLKRIDITPNLIPFSIRLVLMVAIIFLNAHHQISPKFPSSSLAHAKVAYLEDMICRYKLIWEGAKDTLQDFHSAKAAFRQ